MSDPPRRLGRMMEGHEDCPACDCVHKVPHCRHEHNVWG